MDNDKKRDMPQDELQALDTFGERKLDLSQDVVNKTDKETLDFILSKNENELVPWETMTLPSEGAYYDGQIPGGVVKVRPMGIFAEKALTTMRLAKTGEALDMIFENCVQYPNAGFNPQNLVVGDSTFLLFYLRGITFGNMYEFIVRCTNPECGHAMTKTFDLNTLQATIKKPISEGGKFVDEPFEHELPYLSKTMGKSVKVKIRLMRRYDMRDIMVSKKIQGRLLSPTNVQATSLSKGFQKAVVKQSMNDMVEKNLRLVVVEAMGEKDRFKIDNLVARLTSTDTSSIRDKLDKMSPGIDTTVTVMCDECDNEMKVPLPITESFFRRTIPGGA
jgi:hypothetical protein